MLCNTQSVAAAATDYTCSVVCQLRVPSTPAASQNPCENFNNCGGFPLHISTMTGKVPQNHQVTNLAPGPKSVSTKSTNSPVTNKGHGSQPQGPLVSINNEGPRSPSSSKAGPSSPFSYASAVANRSKAPYSGSVECEQYRALAAKARECPRILSIKLQKPPAPTQEPEKALGQAD